MKPLITILISLCCIHYSLAGVYGDLEFGDSRKTVTEKLDVSTLVTKETTGNIFGNTGLNGSYRCNTKLAGLTYHLHFGWTDSGHLEQITLRSESVDRSRYNDELYKTWQQATEILTNAYQAPTKTNPYPDISKLKSNQFLVSYTWNGPEGVNIILGTGILEEKCFLAIRFKSTDAIVIEKPNDDITE